MSNPALLERMQAAGAAWGDVRGMSMAVDFGDAEGEYAAGSAGAGLYAPLDRGLIEVRGRDRAAWLHNLTTNAIKTLQPGDGNYTFAVNVKGRVLMDFNVLVATDALRLDIDRRLIAKALAHFERFTISEDVQCRDRSDEFARIALLGPRAVEIAAALGVTQAGAMPALASVPLSSGGGHEWLVRHDFAGVFGVELHVASAAAAAWWERLLEIGRPAGLWPVGWKAVDTLRIEAGIPQYGRDIDEEVLPAETGQIERAVSFVKGCYLGQEVVERMRSRGGPARVLVGIRFAGDRTAQEVAAGPLLADGGEVGRLTSACPSPALNAWIGLGYLRTALARPGTRVALAGRPDRAGEVVTLPFRT
ncbi:MAG: aminomethyl transferase family protein [Phycisphaerae bacterium]|jgi:aminomethyltransferase